MKDILKRAWAKFLTVFGDIKLFKWPMFVQYDPEDYAVTGDKVIDAMQVIQPGDVVLRGYSNYLDSFFIRGDYSHAGIYVGDNEIIHAVAPNVTKANIVDFMRCDRIAILRPRKYQNEAIKTAKKFLAAEIPYDFVFATKDQNALYCFELAANCYQKLNVETFATKSFFRLVTREVYYAESFLNSLDFTLVFEYNQKRQIDFCAT